MKKRILIIDDDASVRDSFERLLRLEGHSVVHATGGAAGLQELKDHECDLLLLDLDLSNLKGWEILGFAVEHRPRVAVVVLTALLNQCAVGAFSGTEAVLEKPTDVSLLLQTVTRALLESHEQRVSRTGSNLAPDADLPKGAPCPQDLPAFPAGRSPNKTSHKPAVCDLSLFQTGCPLL